MQGLWEFEYGWSPPGKPESMKAHVVFFHLEFGASFRLIGKYSKVSTVSVMRWVRDRAEKLQKPEIPNAKEATILFTLSKDLFCF